ncbi:MAG TPA: asparagine synthase (glutamine-hydrolyzing) [Candidimonas sp.]|nr:asparagine synthase (glutamine-hydrolyzing) [Candidimonas sp.]
MCGFAGFLDVRRLTANPQDVLARMGQSISHRGPDDDDVWYCDDGGIGFSHRRLAVVDLTATGKQPMSSACGRYVIVFNGEIYNHLALRAQVQSSSSGVVWRGTSDTETLLACFSTWGIEATLRAAVGMFAIALWDRRTRELTLARDRMGEKPLYWGWQGNVLLFGSELKAIRMHPLCKGEIDRDSLALLVQYNYIPAPNSIYTGIEKLRPANYITFRAGQAPGSAVPASYWSLSAAARFGTSNPFLGSDIDAIDTLEGQLSQSVGLQMIADVPLGAFLSGGVDSSLVAALMQAQASMPIQTFTIGFEDAKYNEAVHASAVAAHLGTRHTEWRITARDALDLIPRLADIYCEPFADSSQIPTYLVSKLARQHVTVALSGDGGDELFGGYSPYQFAPGLWKRLGRLPLGLRRLAAQLGAGLPLSEKASKLLNVLPARSREDFYQKLRSHWPQQQKIVLGTRAEQSSWKQIIDCDGVDRFEDWMMLIDTQGYMSDDILLKVDRASMANGLETRVPILDHRVVELAWRLPFHQKIRDGKGKWILRQVLNRHVPEHLIDRPKQGFSIPLGEWLRGPLRDWAETLLDERILREDGYFSVEPIRRAWNAHVHGSADHSGKLWSILMYQAWLQCHIYQPPSRVR